MYVCTCLRMYLSVSMIETACGKFKQCASTESAVFYANINNRDDRPLRLAQLQVNVARTIGNFALCFNMP